MTWTGDCWPIWAWRKGGRWPSGSTWRSFSTTWMEIEKIVNASRRDPAQRTDEPNPWIAEVGRTIGPEGTSGGIRSDGHTPSDKAANLEKVRYFLEQAARQGVEMIAFRNVVSPATGICGSLSARNSRPGGAGFRRAFLANLVTWAQDYSHDDWCRPVEKTPEGQLFNT